jgi:hypothetical protein
VSEALTGETVTVVGVPVVTTPLQVSVAVLLAEPQTHLMLAVPFPTSVASPVAELTVATAVLSDDQTKAGIPPEPGVIGFPF